MSQINEPLSCIYFTRQAETGRYEDSPDFLRDIWPLLTANFSFIDRIYAFTHSERQNVRFKGNEQDEIDDGLLDMGKGADLPQELYTRIEPLCYYGGDRNIFFQIRTSPFLLTFLSIWPYRTKIYQSLDVLRFQDADYLILSRLANRVCQSGVVLITFIHDADSICVIGQFDTLEEILRVIAKNK